jgi:putative ABC transport system permease protein
VVIILSLSIALALAMTLSYQAVQRRITSVRATVGTMVTLSPAGVQGFEGGGEPLTSDQLGTVQDLDHVVSAVATLRERLTTTDTSLISAIDAGSLGIRRNNTSGGSDRVAPPGGAAMVFSPPMTVEALTNPDTLRTASFSITHGELFAAESTASEALIGKALAEKNGLSVGSTFTAYGETITVTGIFDAGNQFSNAGLYMPLATLQRLADREGEIDSIQLKTEDISVTSSVASKVKEVLGDEVVDVTTDEAAVSSTLQPLENIKSISLYGVIGALAAGAVITLLIMVMIVRERRREIGTLKAIGSSNAIIVGQFITEAFVLTSMSAVLGIIVGVIAGNGVLGSLLANTATSSSSVTTAVGNMGAPGGGMGRIAMVGNQLGGSVRDAVTNLQVDIGLPILLYGIGAAWLIAILGSALPAWFISRIRPAEVLRGE